MKKSKVLFKSLSDFWIDVGVDADVHDGSRAIPSAACARFSARALAKELGWKDEAVDEAAGLAMGKSVAEAIRNSLSWADEPWVDARMESGVALCVMGPGVVDEASWRALCFKVVKIGARFGHEGFRSEIGLDLKTARGRWFGASARGFN